MAVVSALRLLIRGVAGGRRTSPTNRDRRNSRARMRRAGQGSRTRGFADDFIDGAGETAQDNFLRQANAALLNPGLDAFGVLRLLWRLFKAWALGPLRRKARERVRKAKAVVRREFVNEYKKNLRFYIEASTTRRTGRLRKGIRVRSKFTAGGAIRLVESFPNTAYSGRGGRGQYAYIVNRKAGFIQDARAATERTMSGRLPVVFRQLGG